MHGEVACGLLSCMQSEVASKLNSKCMYVATAAFFFFEKCDLEIHTRIVFLSLKHCSLSLERGSAKKGVHAIFFVIS